MDCVCSLVCGGWTQCIFLYDRIYPDATGRPIQGGALTGIMELLVPCAAVCVQVPSVPEAFRPRQPRVLGSVGPYIYPVAAHYGEGLPDALRIHTYYELENPVSMFPIIILKKLSENVMDAECLSFIVTWL